MADFDRRQPFGSGFDGRFEKEYRYGHGTGTEHYRNTYGKGAGYNNRTDLDSPYDSQHRNDHNAVVAHNPGVYRTYDLPNQYGSGEPRRLEVVKGNVFSINQIFVTPPRETPYRPPLDLPGQREEAKAPRPTWFNDPEMKRRRRVASYKAYSVEGKIKASLKKSFRWIKYKCSELIHGW